MQILKKNPVANLAVQGYLKQKTIDAALAESWTVLDPKVGSTDPANVISKTLTSWGPLLEELHFADETNVFGCYDLTWPDGHRSYTLIMQDQDLYDGKEEKATEGSLLNTTWMFRDGPVTGDVIMSFVQNGACEFKIKGKEGSIVAPVHIMTSDKGNGISGFAIFDAYSNTTEGRLLPEAGKKFQSVCFDSSCTKEVLDDIFKKAMKKWDYEELLPGLHTKGCWLTYTRDVWDLQETSHSVAFEDGMSHEYSILYIEEWDDYMILNYAMTMYVNSLMAGQTPPDELQYLKKIIYSPGEDKIDSVMGPGAAQMLGAAFKGWSPDIHGEVRYVNRLVDIDSDIIDEYFTFQDSELLPTLNHPERLFWYENTAPALLGKGFDKEKALEYPGIHFTYECDEFKFLENATTPESEDEGVVPLMDMLANLCIQKLEDVFYYYAAEMTLKGDVILHEITQLHEVWRDQIKCCSETSDSVLKMLSSTKSMADAYHAPGSELTPAEQLEMKQLMGHIVYNETDERVDVGGDFNVNGNLLVNGQAVGGGKQLYSHHILVTGNLFEAYFTIVNDNSTPFQKSNIGDYFVDFIGEGSIPATGFKKSDRSPVVCVQKQARGDLLGARSLSSSTGTFFEAQTVTFLRDTVVAL